MNFPFCLVVDFELVDSYLPIHSLKPCVTASLNACINLQQQLKGRMISRKYGFIKFIAKTTNLLKLAAGTLGLINLVVGILDDMLTSKSHSILKLLIKTGKQVNPIQDVHFWDCSLIGCYRYPALIKLGAVIPCLERIPKIYKSHDTSLNSACINDFFIWNSQLLLYREKK